MQFIKKTWNRMIYAIITLITLLWCLSIYMAWQNGSMRGYELGLLRGEIDSQFKPYIEAKRSFCYDEGIIYTVRKGKKVFIPEF